MNTPTRAYRLILKLEADNRDHMATALFDLAARVSRDELTTGVSGGKSSSAIYELLSDPSQTHERYFSEVHEYLAALKEPKP